MYDLVIFDLDGTLYKYEYEEVGSKRVEGSRFHREIRERATDFISEKLGISVEKAAEVRNMLIEKYEGSVSVGVNREYGIKRSEYLSYTWDIDAIKYMEPDPKLRKLLSSITIKKALLTASPEIWARRALKRLEVEDCFEGVWTGDDEIRKPLREAYLRVTSALKAKPENTMIVEDEVRYLKPAKEVGMTTVLVGPLKESFIDHNLESVYEVKKLLGKKGHQG